MLAITVSGIAAKYGNVAAYALGEMNGENDALQPRAFPF
jgi:hypothetical protein